MPTPGLGSIAYESFYWVLTVSTVGFLPKMLKLKAPKTVGTQPFESLKSKIERNIADAKDVLKTDELAQKKLARLREAVAKADASIAHTKKLGLGIRLAAGLAGLLPCLICCCCLPILSGHTGSKPVSIEGESTAESPSWIRGDWTKGALPTTDTTFANNVNLTFTAGSVMLTNNDGETSTERLLEGVVNGSRYQVKAGYNTCVFELAGDAVVVSECSRVDGRYRRGTTEIAPKPAGPTAAANSPTPAANTPASRIELQISVQDKKENGADWDAFGNLPDIAACVSAGETRRCEPGGRSSVSAGTRVSCRDATTCSLSIPFDAETPTITVEIIDVDATSNDAMGSANCPTDGTSCSVGQATVIARRVTPSVAPTPTAGESVTQTPEWLRGTWKLDNAATRWSYGFRCDYRILVSSSSINATATATRGQDSMSYAKSQCEERDNNSALGTRPLTQGVLNDEIFVWNRAPATADIGVDPFQTWSCRFERVGEELLVSECGAFDGNWKR